MAKRVRIDLIDDLDGSEATTTMTFAFEETQYTIDLSESNATKFREAFAPWIESATSQAGKASNTRTPGRGGVERTQREAVREWARMHGYKVSARGRIPTSVLEAYGAED